MESMATSKVKASGWHKLENVFTYQTGWQDTGSAADFLATEVYESRDFYVIYIRSTWNGTGNSDQIIATNFNLPNALVSVYGELRVDNDSIPLFYSSTLNRLRYYGEGLQSGKSILGSIIIPKG